MPSILIEGRPIPKMRVRVGQRRAYTPERNVAWERSIALQAASSRVRVRDVSLSVEIEFVTKKKLTGDIDNYAKSVLDGLEKARVFENDRRIEWLLAYRHLGTHDFTRITLEEYDGRAGRLQVTA